MKNLFSIMALVACAFITQSTFSDCCKGTKKQEKETVLVASNEAQTDEKCNSCEKEDTEQVQTTEPETQS